MTKQELIQGIEDMQAGLNDVDAAFRPKLQEKIEEFKKKLAQIEAEETMQMLSSTTSKPVPAPVSTAMPSTEPKSNSNDEYGVQQIVQMMQALMSEPNGGGSVDSVQVRNLIKTYLENDKVQLNELDQRVIDFIKQNQKVTLELPAFGMNIEMSKADSKIPNIYSIIDDVLAGNNVYLIGEAGGGKTYTAETVAQLEIFLF
jgi:ABC-type glutathione transport system ATPase component